MSKPSVKEMRTAIASRDNTYDGSFFYGVITTGIFCNPSCPSRAAKAENLRFFINTKDAIANGFRPCKKCQPIKPLESANRMVKIAEYIDTHVEDRLTLATLATIAELSPSRLQRLFKEFFGVSPKVYQNSLRMQKLKQSLKEEGGITNAIFSAGYNSVSQVYGDTTQSIGMTPKAYRTGGAGENIIYAYRNTALGPMLMAATVKGICFVQFDDDQSSLMGKLTDEFPKATFSVSPAQDSPELDSWIEALNLHISHNAPQPNLPLDLRGTVFQMKVWRFLLSINEGEVLSYKELAIKMQMPKAARSIGTACAANRIGVLIPCHRVIRGDGGLGGYRWGLKRKQALLDKEQQCKIDALKSNRE